MRKKVRWPPPETVAGLLVNALRSSKPGPKPRRPRPDDVRGGPSFHQTDIISSALCDDVLQYLAPTLEKYKGCTLIDFHPGASVWSSRLHDFLQPKRHLLIEPEVRYYDEFIKPLLDQPNSTYRYTSFPKYHPHSYFRAWKTIQDDRSLLDERPSVQPVDPPQRAVDSNVLVTGNLARRYYASTFSYNTKAGSLAFFLSKLVSAALQNDAYHGPGLVRQLWWFPEGAKKAILPSRLIDKHAIAAGFDMAFSTSEVAGVTPYPLYGSHRNREMKYGRISRFRSLDILNEAEVAKRMTTENLVVPENRSLLKADPAVFPEESGYKSPFLQLLSSAAELQKSISVLKDRLRDMQEHWPDLIRRRSRTELPERLSTYFDSIEYPQTTQAFDTWPGTNAAGGSRSRLAVLLDMALRILRLEASFKEVEANEPDEPSIAQMRDTIIAFGDDLQNLGLQMNSLIPQSIQHFVNEELAANTVDSPFNLQKRRYEPLQATKKDFWPRNELTLVDMAARTTDLSVPGLASQAEGARFCYTLIQHLYNSPSSPLPVALDKMAINAGKDLIPMVPAITDVRQGGRLDPMQMTPRMLTHDMIVGLVNAFFEWPFRPQNWELELGMESGDFAASEPPEQTDEAEKE